MLYNRVCSLIIGAEGEKGVELSGLRISFSIQKGAVKSPNKCSVKVWNLSTSNREITKVIGNICILKAGYADDKGSITIFAGTIMRSVTTRENADFVTEIELLDGGLEFRDAKVSVSFAAGATATQVIKQLTASFGLPVRPLPDDVADRQYTAGFAFVGRVRDGLDKVCNYMGLEWSIQNREIQIVKKGGHLKQKAIVLSSDTGMIGSPALESKTMTEKAASKQGITKSQSGVRITTRRDKEGKEQKKLEVTGYKVKSLLQPTIEPGGYVQIKSRDIDGQFFRVEEVIHSGDTHGQEWQSEVTLRFI